MQSIPHYLDNPLMDTCNLVISMAGVCDVSKPTLADISKY